MSPKAFIFTSGVSYLQVDLQQIESALTKWLIFQAKHASPWTDPVVKECNAETWASQRSHITYIHIHPVNPIQTVFGILRF
jgi:hypothetical protein